MSKDNKWRREADRILSSPVIRKRGLNTVIGRVEDRFDGIFTARRQGVTWKVIANALKYGDEVTVAAVESAFKRICHDKSVAPPSGSRRHVNTVARSTSADTTSSAVEQPTLFAKRERYVDDGY